MPGISTDIDADEVGFDPVRLRRIDALLQSYVDRGFLPGCQFVLGRGDHVAHTVLAGSRDLESGAPFTDDTIVRLYAMTKPITSVAAMMLYEEGAFELKDPVAKFIPSFADVQVYRSGSSIAPTLEPATEPVRIWHLLTHTAGLTYGFHHNNAVDAAYRAAGFEWGTPKGADLAACCDLWAQLPLLFQPGSEWNYSVCTDVLGRVVEVASGMSLDAFFAERILGPLGMVDTAFSVPADDVDRLAALYSPAPGTRLAKRNDAMGAAALAPPTCLSGGGGLVGTAHDYHRFTRMLLGGGELDGVRLLGPRTVDYMTTNHLPGGQDLTAFGRPLFSETQFDGVGFGLGFSVVEDVAAYRVLSSPGTYAWGGAASTAFWVDPYEGITAVLLTQLLPSSTHPIRTQLMQLVLQAVVD